MVCVVMILVLAVWSWMVDWTISVHWRFLCQPRRAWLIPAMQEDLLHKKNQSMFSGRGVGGCCHNGGCCLIGFPMTWVSPVWALCYITSADWKIKECSCCFSLFHTTLPTLKSMICSLNIEKAIWGRQLGEAVFSPLWNKCEWGGLEYVLQSLAA